LRLGYCIITILITLNLFALMKQFYAIVWLLFLGCTSALLAQNVLITSQNPDGLYVCGTDQLTVKLTNSGAATLNNVIATVTLPAGISYVPGTVSGATEQNIGNLSAPRFSAGTLAVGGEANLTITVRADCGLVSQINSGQLFNNTITATYTGGTNTITTNNYPVETGLLVIVSATPFTQAGEIGQMLQRTIVVKNTRLGPIERVEFRDIHFPGYTGDAPGAVISENPSPVLFRAEYTGNFFAGFGDGDNLLEFNEEATLIEKIMITDCGTPSFDNPSQLRVGWGCNNSICQSDSTEAEVTILTSTQNPEIQFVTKYTHPTSYCSAEPDVQEMYIINTGELPAANVILDMRTNNPGGFSAMDPNSFEYNAGSGWQPIVPNLNNETQLACDIQVTIATNTLIVVPTVPANDTTFVRFESYSCSPPCNQAIVPFFAYTFYEKVCPVGANLTDSIPWVVDTASQFIRGTPRFNIDSCMVIGQSYQLDYILRSPRLLTDDGFAQYRMLLPNGIEFDPSCGIPTVWGQPPVLQTITPNTGPNNAFTEVLLAYQLPFPADTGVLRFCVKPICPTDSVNCENQDGEWAQEGSQVTLYPQTCAAGCGLRNFWEASITNTPDADSGCGLMDCVDFLMFVDYEDCPAGGGGGGGGGGGFDPSIAQISYETYRLNYGLKDDDDDRDADSNAPPTQSLVRRDRYIPGDTLRFDLKGVVIDGSLSTANFKVFTESMTSDFGVNDGDNYALLPFAVGLFPHKDSLQFVRANLRIKKANGQTSTCPVNWDPTAYAHRRYVAFQSTNVQPPAIQDQLIGMNREFEIDFTACSPDGQPLGVGDSLFFTYDYYFNVNFLPPLSGQVPRLINFRNSLWTGEYAWREPEPVLPGPLSQYSGYIRNRTFPRHTIRPCETSAQQNPFAFGVRLARGNMFPYEVRQIARVTDLLYDIPDGADLQTALTDVTLQETDVFITDLPLTWSVSGQTHTFDMDPVYARPLDEGYRLQTDFTYAPSCSFFGPDTTKVTFNIQYPEDFPGPSTEMLMRRDITGMLDAQPILNPVFGSTVLNLSTSDFAIDFTLRNTRPAVAPNAWMYVEPLNGDINDVQLLFMPQGTPVPGVGGLYQLGNVGVLAQVPLRLQATNGNCDALKVNLIFGWGCETVNSPLGSSCNRDTVLLNLRLRNAVLELDVINQPNSVPLCQPSDFFTFEVSNANDGNATGLTPSIKLPAGLSVVPGSTQVQYPAGGNWVSTSDPDLLPGNIFQWQAAEILPGLTSGLPGFNTAPENAFRIRFRVIAECGFVANAQPIYGVEGVQPCGTSTNILRKPDDPIGLDGVSPAYGVDISLSPASTNPVSCDGEITISVQIQVDGDPAANDSVYLALPIGVSYVPGSYVAVQNAPSGGPLVQGQNLQIGFPANLGPGGIMKFDLKVKYDDAAGCIDRFIIAQTRQRTTGFCPSNNQNCTVYLATGEALLQIPAANPDLIVDNFTPGTSTGGGFNFTLDLNNEGNVNANNSEVELWLDANGNGLPDQGEQLIQTINYNQVIVPNGSATLSGVVNLPLDQLCNLLAVLPAAENCACAPKYFPLDDFVVDQPTIARCVVEPVTLGVPPVAGNSYAWQPSGLLSCSDCANPTFNPGSNVSVGDAFIFVLVESAGTCSIERRYEVIFGGALGVETPDPTICRGDTVTLTASAGGTYSWTGPGVNATAQSQQVSPQSTTTYSVTVTLAAGCTGTDVVTVSVLEASNITLTTVDICEGGTALILGQVRSQAGTYVQRLTKTNGCDSIRTQTLRVFPVSGASNVTICGGGEVEIFPGVVVSTAGIYRDTFTNTANCDSIHTVTVTVAPALNLPALDTLKFPEGGSIQIDAPGGFANYQWAPEGGLTCTNCEDPIASPDSSTTYLLTVTDNNGCTDTASLRVIVAPPCFEKVQVPNAFTPDGDGINDVFRMVPFQELGFERASRLTVYNRWGQKIYESTENPTWDGKHQGADAPVDVYIFILEIECNGEFKIWEKREVTLLR
jgi:gliding motility-associated-like protein/uncharacterized repeat protein (TIGR01451 family)